MAKIDNMPASKETYGGFLSLMKYGTIVSVIAVAVVIALIA